MENKKIEIGDIIEITLVYSDSETENLEIKLVSSNGDHLKGEISIDSVLGNYLLGKESGYEGSYFSHNEEIKVFISKIKGKVKIY